MDYLYNNNKLSMPQQVDINTKEIAILKKTVITPAMMYNANIEISTSAGVISQSNVIEIVSTTDNSYILDTVGSLFKIINIVNDNIYILYVSSIRGQKGDTGEQGEAGTPADPLTVYPIGSIYMSFANVSPAELFGGQWEQIKDKFLLASGDTYINGTTGGNSTHTHNLYPNNVQAHITVHSDKLSIDTRSTTWTSDYEPTGITRGSQVYNAQYYGAGVQGITEDSTNIPPYLVVNVWKRVY